MLLINELFADMCTGGTTDLIFVVDASGSICNDEPVSTCENWETVLSFMDGLIEGLVVGAEDTRVGVVVYGNFAYLRIGLTEYDTEEDIQNAVKALVYEPNKGTNTSGGIQVMREEFANNARDGAAKISLIITDGRATRDAESTVPNAQGARDDGIIIFAIGVTHLIDEAELRALASESGSVGENVFLSPSFDALGDIEAAVTTEICEVAEPVLGL